MGRLIVDAATSADGFWAEACQRTVFASHRVRMDLSGRSRSISGAVVMGARTLQSGGRSAWAKHAREAEIPVFVVCDRGRKDVSAAQRPMHFMESYAAAFSAARKAAGDRAVLVVGEAGAVRAALHCGEADEVRLRLVSQTLGQGIPVLDTDIPSQNYFVSRMETTPDAVHMHLERRLEI